MALKGSVTTGEYSNRSVTLSWTATQSISNNTSTIKWTLKGSGSYSGWVRVSEIRIKIAGKQVYYRNSDHHTDTYNGTQICSGSTTLNHNADGSKSFTVSVEAGIYQWAINKSGSKTFSLNIIPRASSISCGTLTLGTTGTISVSRASTSFTHTITYLYGTRSGTICTKSSSTSISWIPPLSLAHMTPNATSGRGTMTCDTYNGNTKIGSKSLSFTCYVPPSVKPSCSIAALTNTNAIFGCYAKLLSGVKVKPLASGSYSSTISSLKISVTGMSDKSASSGTEYTFDPFTSTGVKTITVTAKDSRGRTNSATVKITVFDYRLPTANISASRGIGNTVDGFVPDDTGDHAKIVSSGSVSSISGNTITPVLQYRIVGQSAWTNLNISTSSLNLSDIRVIAVLDTQAYDIRLIIRDSAGKEAVAIMTLSNGFATMDYKAGGDGIAFGKTATRAGIDCAMIMRILKGVQLMNETTPGGYGLADWYYNNNGTQQKNGAIYAASDGIHVKAHKGKGFLDGTWSGSLSDRRMKRDIEPIARNIIQAVGEVQFVQFRMSAPDYDHEEVYVGILAQDLRNAFARHGVEDKLLMLGTRKLNPDDENEYYCIEYTHFLLVRLLYDELQMQDFNNRIETLEKKLGI